jgi:hypothetical protein
MTIILITLLFVIIILTVYGFAEFYTYLDGDSDSIIKDGLITEYVNKHEKPDVYFERWDSDKVIFNKIMIKEKISGYLFPYHISVVEDPRIPYASVKFIGYVVFLSKDWWTVRKLMNRKKEIKVNKNITQRHMLDL